MRHFLKAALAMACLTSLAWSENREYPRYEPPRLEDLPTFNESAPEKAPTKLQAPSSEPTTGENAAAAPEPKPVEPAPAVTESATAPESAAPQAESSAPSEEPVAESPIAEPAKTVVKPAPAAVAMKRYKVWIYQENGDSLSQIAKKVYGDPQKWRLIYLANKDKIKDPKRIYPKQQLRIPPADWQPPEEAGMTE
jgi:P-type Cu2+ transporter